MSKFVAAYARVSSSKQRDTETIQSQIDSLYDFAAKKDLKIRPEWLFKDDGVSGATLNRPALDALLELVRHEDVATVLVYSPDRLSRKYAHQLVLEIEFEKRGTKLKYCNIPKTTTPEEVLSKNFMSIFAEYERTQIAERCRRGKLYQAKQGNPSVLSGAPYGYNYVAKTVETKAEIIINPEKADTIKNVFTWYTQRHLSMSKIAQKLNDNGIATPKGGKEWNRSTIQDILNNSTYAGTAYFGKTENSEGVQGRIFRTNKGVKRDKGYHCRKLRSQEYWIPIQVPALISQNEFDLAQEQLIKNRERASRNTKEPSILQGVLICGKCSRPYYKKRRVSNGKDTTFYCCSGRLNKGLCNNSSIKQKEVDQIIWDHLMGLLKNPILIEQEIDRRIAEGGKIDASKEMRCQLKSKISCVEKAMDKLLDAYEESDCLSIEQLQVRMKKLTQKKNHLEKELKGLEASSIKKRKELDLKKAMVHFTDTLKCSSEEMTIKDRQKVVRLLINEVIIGDEIKVNHCIPMPAKVEAYEQLRPLRPDRLHWSSG